MRVRRSNKPPVRISETSKLDGILSWSLQALDTCPGSRGADGELVPACSGCYATAGNYSRPNVIEPRLFNREDWQRDGWVGDMVLALEREEYFRWFDSGDMYSVELAWAIYYVMVLTPWVDHWLPTRMYKFAKFREVLEAMAALPNVMVRFSSDEVDGTYVPGVHGSCIVPADMPTPEGAKRCHAYEHEGKCNGCRACWDKNVPVIVYQAHGVKMAKVIRLRVQAA